MAKHTNHHRSKPLSTLNKFQKRLRKEHKTSLLLIGAPGSGKTTLMKRITNAIITFESYCWLLNFAEYTDDHPISLNDLLIINHLEDTDCGDPSSVDSDIKWIMSNQCLCTLVLDGIDQSTFTINPNPPKGVKANEKVKPSILFGLILTRKLLPDVRLVMSSQPHSVNSFVRQLRSDMIAYVNDLEEADMILLLKFHFKGAHQALLNKLKTTALPILRLMYTPLFIFLIAIIHKNGPDNILDSLKTQSKVFEQIFKLLKISNHNHRPQSGANDGKGTIDLKLVDRALSELAYEKTLEGSVVITSEDFERYNLIGETVQNLMLSSSRMIKGNSNFYFQHQTLQVSFEISFYR